MERNTAFLFDVFGGHAKQCEGSLLALYSLINPSGSQGTIWCSEVRSLYCLSRLQCYLPLRRALKMLSWPGLSSKNKKLKSSGLNIGPRVTGLPGTHTSPSDFSIMAREWVAKSFIISSSRSRAVFSNYTMALSLRFLPGNDWAFRQILAMFEGILGCYDVAAGE